MSLSLVQHGTNGPTFVNSGTAGQILPATCGVGSTVVAIIITNGGAANNVSSIASGIGTFTKVCDEGEGSSVWVCQSATGAADTITPTLSGATQWVAIGMEWSGGVTGMAALSSTTGGGNQFTETFSNAIGQTLIGYYEFPTITSDPGAPWTEFTAWTGGPHVVYQASASGANASAQWNQTGTGSPNYGGITLIGNSGSGFFAFF